MKTASFFRIFFTAILVGTLSGPQVQSDSAYLTSSISTLSPAMNLEAEGAHLKEKI